MRKMFATVLAVMILCNMMVLGVDAAGIPNNITQLKDDPAADKPDYEIHVNRALNYTVVYAQDAMGEFTVPVIAFANSTGKNNSTPIGNYTITKKHRWQLMFGGVYTQYAVRFMPHIMFHSAYYTAKNNSALKWQEYNKLGQQASSGCVREAAIDSKWLYDNCKIGTKVVVYDDPDDLGPFGMPRTVTIPADSPYRGWDPTDPDPENPWRELRPILHLVSDEANSKVLILPFGSSREDIEAEIGLYTPQGVPYVAEEYALEIYGNYNLDVPGCYEIYVRGFDLATTLRADETFVLWVMP